MENVKYLENCDKALYDPLCHTVEEIYFFRQLSMINNKIHYYDKNELFYGDIET